MDANLLGRKSGKGFYVYDDKDKKGGLKALFGRKVRVVVVVSSS